MAESTVSEDPSAAGGVLSYSLRMIGVGAGRDGEASARLVSVSEVGNEAAQFVARFEQDFGTRRPNFVSEGFMDALQRSRNSFKLLFVYMHSPDHLDTPSFCERTLCSEMLVDYINENFVSWGGSIGASEGFKMSNSLKASIYPFCAVVMAATNQRIVLLQQLGMSLSLGAEPEKGPDVTQVVVRFPTGQRKERRFHSTALIQNLYDFVDSLGCLDAEKYSLVSNFP